MDDQKQLREHLLELLEGKSAHIDTESALDGYPVDKINMRIDGSPHTAWELLEHIRIAQWDILDFSTNPNYKEMKWPDDYWTEPEGTVESWRRSVEQVLGDLQAVRDLVADEKTDLYAKIPHGSGQTIFREALLVADHNAYHIGQLVLLRRIFENQ
ncbi:MAG TPA: DinB family protein [Pyrinomonadaceae bacterium]|jgi:hypothetical protein|nr:DinB family protein [Pyrinomonadaceae bacterium]